MALRNIMKIVGPGYIQTAAGQVALGDQNATFTAYCKITTVNGNKEGGRIAVECSADNYNVVKQYDVPFSVEDGAPNFIKQGYEHLKTLPEYKDAVDC